MTSLLDPGQVLKQAFDDASGSLKTSVISGTLVTDPFDYTELTYVAAGNGAGQIETVTYKSGGASGTVVAVLTLTYDSSDRLETVTRS